MASTVTLDMLFEATLYNRRLLEGLVARWDAWEEKIMAKLEAWHRAREDGTQGQDEVATRKLLSDRFVSVNKKDECFEPIVSIKVEQDPSESEADKSQGSTYDDLAQETAQNISAISNILRQRSKGRQAACRPKHPVGVVHPSEEVLGIASIHERAHIQGTKCGSNLTPKASTSGILGNNKPSIVEITPSAAGDVSWDSAGDASGAVTTGGKGVGAACKEGEDCKFHFLAESWSESGTSNHSDDFEDQSCKKDEGNRLQVATANSVMETEDLSDKECGTSAGLALGSSLSITGKLYQCELCPYQSSRKSKFIRHQNVHSGVRPYVCEICGKRFALKGNMKAHHNTLHVDAKPYSCDLCDKKFNWLPRLEQHRRIHTGERPFPCELCTKSFTARSALSRHMRLHTAGCT